MIEHDGLDVRTLFPTVPQWNPNCENCVTYKRRLRRACDYEDDTVVVRFAADLDRHVARFHPG